MMDSVITPAVLMKHEYGSADSTKSCFFYEFDNETDDKW